MGKRRAREIWEYDSMAEFEADGGAAGYGEGNLIIAGISYRAAGGELTAIDSGPHKSVSVQAAKPLLIYAQTFGTGGSVSPRFNVVDMKYGTIVISGLVAETVQLKPVYADLADVGAGVGIYVRKADGTLVQATALANGTYNIENLSCTYLDVVKSANVNPLTLQGELRGERVNTDKFSSSLAAKTAANVTRLATAGYGVGMLTISGLVAETIKLAPVFADGQVPAGRGILVKNMAGAISEALTLGNGVYQIETFGCPFIDVVKSGAVNPVTLVFEAV